MDESAPKADHISAAMMKAASFLVYQTLMNMAAQPEASEWTDARANRLIAYVAQELEIDYEDVLQIIAAHAQEMLTTVTVDRDKAKIDAFFEMVEAWR
ncbi:glutaminase [Sinorhizobium fredii]|uniref:hypothetical protein n=1 Tax=Rhizobium fredii TaxID=380 RepID=UPI003510F953